MLKFATLIAAVTALYSVYLPSLQVTIFDTGVMITCAIITAYNKDD